MSKRLVAKDEYAVESRSALRQSLKFSRFFAVCTLSQVVSEMGTLYSITPYSLFIFSFGLHKETVGCTVNFVHVSGNM